MSRTRQILRDTMRTNKKLFPKATAIGTVKKLIGEAKELEEAEIIEADKAVRIMELADCLACVLTYATLNGFTLKEVLEALDTKTQINKGRKWKYNSEKGNYQHIATP